MSLQAQRESLIIIAQIWRWSYPTDIIGIGSLYRVLKPIFSDLGIEDHQEQIRIVSACIGRPVSSFKEVLGGEIKALVEAENLKDIIRQISEEF